VADDGRLDWTVVPRHEPGWRVQVERPSRRAVEVQCVRCGRLLRRAQRLYCSLRCNQNAYWWRKELERYWEQAG
jgi:hypothetical protein